MEHKHIAVVVVGGIALTFLVHYLIKRYMPATVSQTDVVASAAPQMTTPVAAYTPVSNAYTPLPVGAITPGADGHTSQLPPGISESSVMLPTVQPVKTVADPGTTLNQALSSIIPDPVQHDTTDPTSQGVNSLTGNAALIDARYVALFGRHAEQAGLDFWSNAMNSGAVTAASLDKDLTRGAQTTDQGAEVVNNPSAVIQYRNG